MMLVAEPDGHRLAGAGRSPSPAVVLSSLRADGKKYFKRTVSTWPPAKRLDWLESREAITIMGAEWCGRRRRVVEAIQERLQDLVPSGAWLEAAWSGGEAFPPQDPFCPLAVAARLYGLAADGHLRLRDLRRGLRYLTLGVDWLQVIRRGSARMVLSQQHTRTDAGDLDLYQHPLPRKPSQRMTPSIAVALEDEVDQLGTVDAIFYKAPASPSAMAIWRVSLRQGKDKTIEDQKRRQRKREREKKLEAARRKAGVELDEDGQVMRRGA